MIDISALTASAAGEAARLLQQRHRLHRLTEPLLSGGDLAQEVAAALEGDNLEALAAREGGEVAGYLLARRRRNRDFGRHVWIGRSGHAATRAELIRDLYTTAAAAWAGADIRRHYVEVPAAPEMLDPWYRLGFGQMHVDGIRPVAAGPGSSPPPGVTIRPGGTGDIERVAIPIDALIAQSQADSPSFSRWTPPSPASQHERWRATLAVPEAAYFVAESGGRAVGHALVYPADPALGTPPDALHVASTATVPDRRGEGIGGALAGTIFDHARRRGCTTLVTNWRVTNLEASRFWTALGFRPTFIRLFRVLGHG